MGRPHLEQLMAYPGERGNLLIQSPQLLQGVVEAGEPVHRGRWDQVCRQWGQWLNPGSEAHMGVVIIVGHSKQGHREDCGDSVCKMLITGPRPVCVLHKYKQFYSPD